jgi:hypothetical protein
LADFKKGWELLPVEAAPCAISTPISPKNPSFGKTVLKHYGHFTLLFSEI